MKDIVKKLNKVIVAIGVACLLLGLVGYSQPAQGSLTFLDGSVFISVSGTDHYSYGNWSFPTGNWYSANTQDGWTSASVNFDMAWGWTAWILYSLYHGWSEEVTFLYDVDY